MRTAASVFAACVARIIRTESAGVRMNAHCVSRLCRFSGIAAVITGQKGMSQTGMTIDNVLDSIQHPTDVAKLDADQLRQLADELRERIIGTVSQNGGHLAPSLEV